jgi:hypothetical protein
MSQEIPYNATVRYRYDGEDEDILLTVLAGSAKQAREVARKEAQGILEEGAAFRITDVIPEGYQWEGLHCVFTLREMAELGAQLTQGKKPQADLKAINTYIDRLGRYDTLRASKVKASANAGELGIQVLWNAQVCTTY